MRLQNSFYNHISALGFLLFGVVITIVALYWFEFTKAAVLVFGISYVLGAIPALCLHGEYYLRNKEEVYEVQSNSIIQYKSSLKRTYHHAELEKITLYMAPGMYKRSEWQFLAIESYHYAHITTTSGEELIIT